MDVDKEKEERKSFIDAILEKAFGKDSKPEPYKKQVTEEDLRKTEEQVKRIQERIR